MYVYPCGLNSVFDKRFGLLSTRCHQRTRYDLVLRVCLHAARPAINSMVLQFAEVEYIYPVAAENRVNISNLSLWAHVMSPCCIFLAQITGAVFIFWYWRLKKTCNRRYIIVSRCSSSSHIYFVSFSGSKFSNHPYMFQATNLLTITTVVWFDQRAQ